jgi:hypothetical protein
MNTYTCIYTSVARNLSQTAQAALMVSSAPISAGVMANLTESGLTFVSDNPALGPGTIAARIIVFQDSPVHGSMPPGVPMADLLTNMFTGSIQDGIQAPVTGFPVIVT